MNQAVLSGYRRLLLVQLRGQRGEFGAPQAQKVALQLLQSMQLQCLWLYCTVLKNYPWCIRRSGLAWSLVHKLFLHGAAGYEIMVRIHQPPRIQHHVRTSPRREPDMRCQHAAQAACRDDLHRNVPRAVCWLRIESVGVLFIICLCIIKIMILCFFFNPQISVSGLRLQGCGLSSRSRAFKVQ